MCQFVTAVTTSSHDILCYAPSVFPGILPSQLGTLLIELTQNDADSIEGCFPGVRTNISLGTECACWLQPPGSTALACEDQNP